MDTPMSANKEKQQLRRDARRSRLPRDLLGAAVTVGAVGAVAAAVEAVAAPALVVGAVVLAPRYFPGLFGKRRSAEPPRRAKAAVPAKAVRPPASDEFGWRGLKIGQSLAKTVTYRVGVSGLDFSWNYMILGDAAVSAGLSAASLVLAPLFYFVHETVWNTSRLARLTPAAPRQPLAPAIGGVAPRGQFTVDRALFKTITFRAFASVSEVATNYVVVQDMPTALALSAFGLVFGPFLYYGHEKLWERFGPQPAQQAAAVPLRPPAAT